MEPSAHREEYQPRLGPPELTVTSFPWWDGPVLGVKESGALGRGRPDLPARTAPSASVSSSLHGSGGGRGIPESPAVAGTLYGPLLFICWFA